MDDEKNKNVSRRLKPTCPRNVFLARIRNLKRQIDNEFASINRAATCDKDPSIIHHKRRKQYC